VLTEERRSEQHGEGQLEVEQERGIGREGALQTQC
jgi:hypothetical protein